MNRFRMNPGQILTDSVGVLAQIAARMVTETIALGRFFHYRYPKHYTVGLLLRETSPGHADITVRVDDARYTFRAIWALGEQDGGDFMDELMRGCSAVVHVWADAHPEYLPDRSTAGAVVGAMDTQNDAFIKRATAAAREIAMKASYRSGSRWEP